MSCSTVAMALICAARYPITPRRMAIAVMKRADSLRYRTATTSGSETGSHSSAKSRSRFASRMAEKEKPMPVQTTIQIELMPIR